MVTKFGTQHKSSFFQLVLSDAENQAGDTTFPIARMLPSRHNGPFEVQSIACPDDIFIVVHRPD